MLVPVLSRDIQIELVCDYLREYGLVVIETTRTHAKSIATETINALEINKEFDDDVRFIHLATEVTDRGWSDFFMYSRIYDYVPGKTQQIVLNAVLSWAAANSPDNYIVDVCT